jgi:outer membrane protein TolC
MNGILKERRAIMCKRIKRLKTTGGVIAISLVSSIAWIVKAQTPKDVSAGQRVVAEEKGSAAASMPRGFSATEADYVAPKKPLPPLTRVGVETSEPLPLTLNEAIRLALVNNNDITTSRIEVEMSEDDLNAARGAYDPRMTSEFYFQHNKLPLTSFLGGNSNGALSTNNLSNSFGVTGNSPRAGGSYKFEFASTRTSTDNFFNDLNPVHSNSFNISYTQPLMRGRRTDDNRRKIEIAKKNLTLTDVEFRQRATEVITRVEQAYWDLVFALKNFQVQSDATNQARQQVETNRRQVNQGVLAPIDVTEAEAQVKIYEQNIYAAKEEITRAENNLKTLMLAERRAEMWSRALMPVTPVTLEGPSLLLPDALKDALQNRLELAELRTNDEINQIDRRYYRHQLQPQMDLTLGYSTTGLSGTVTKADDNPLRASVTALEQRVNDLSTRAGLTPMPATSFGAVPSDMQGGYGQSLANMLGQDNPTFTVGVSISLPFKNRTAKANLAKSLAEDRRIDTLKAKAEQLIEAEVRNAMQGVRSVEARLAAAAASREAAEQQYTSEQRRFQAGMSTVFLVLQRQTDLTNARGRELQTQTDLNKAIAELQRAMGNTFRYRNVAVITDGHRLQQTLPSDADASSTQAGNAKTGGSPQNYKPDRTTKSN